MKYRDTVCTVLGLILCLPLVGGNSPGQSVDRATYDWKEKMSKAEGLGRKHNLDAALQAYDEAIAMAPTPEHKADSLFYKAVAYQTALKRWDAMAVYQRIIDECPGTVHACQAYLALAALHNGVLDLPDDAPESDKKRAAAEMSLDVAIGYVKKVIETASPSGTLFYGARRYLAGLYAEAGRIDEGRAILLELNDMDIYDVKDPRYVGPYQKLTLYSSMSRSSMIDGARCDAVNIRYGVRLALVNLCVTTSDPAKSIANLRALIEKYPGGELAQLAQAEIDRITAHMAKDAAEAAKAGAGAPPAAGK